MSEEDAFHFDPNLVCEMEGLGQSPFPRELMTAYVSSLSRAHMPGAGNTLPLYPTCLPSLTQTRRELVYYQTFSWLQGWVHQFCPMGTAKFSWEQWRENCYQVRPWRTLGPNVAIMINSLVLHDLPWNSQFSLSPLRCPNQTDLHSVLRLYLLTWLMTLGFFILLLFWPKCYLSLTTQTKFHVSLEVYCVHHIPQIFSSFGLLKECSHILIYAHHPSNKY